jgi:PLP dependent protein
MKVKLSEDKEFSSIEENIKQIRENVAESALKSGRNYEDIRIMAVTKTIDAERVNFAVSCGMNLIGENRVQEYLNKLEDLELSNCEVHMIGHLQSNKVKQIVGKVSMIQSVDSTKTAKEIGLRSLEAGITTDILMEINSNSEDSKFGFSTETAIERAFELSEIQGIKVCGMMSVPPMSDNMNINRQNFSNIRRLFIDICNKRIDNVCMGILSMGMSGDYPCAILEGSNLIRVGSAVFGTRKY